MSSKRAIGRPTVYTQAIADEICAQLSMGKSLRKVCFSTKMPAIRTVFNWLRTNEDFMHQYARAKEESADAQLEELTELGDKAIKLAKALPGQQAAAAVQAVRLKADNIKWSMSKMKPKKYGDKLDLTSDGERMHTPPAVISVITPRTKDAQTETEASEGS